MPFEHRIDEIFERYYRWDRQSEDRSAVESDLENDKLILESKEAGHEWDIEEFNTPSGTVYVPYTEPVLDNRFVIKKHQYFNPADAIGQIVDNGMANITDYGSFVGGTSLPEFTGGTKHTVKVASHDHKGELHTDDEIPEQLYVIKESCEINLNDYPDSSFFIDPSDNLNTSDVIKIVLKGVENHSGSEFYFIVNNTADYAGDDYKNPSPYCTATPSIKSAARIQVQVFLDETFGTTNAKPHFMTTGAWHQMCKETELNVVQNPPFPSEENDLSTISKEIRYCYELIPNFTMFGAAGKEYIFENSNGAKFNADIAMPLSSITFENVNSGSYKVNYYETVNSKNSVGEVLPLWSISSIMLENLKYNDNYAMTAYVGGIGTSLSSPPPTITTSSGSGGSARLGENRNPWFNNEHIGN